MLTDHLLPSAVPCKVCNIKYTLYDRNDNFPNKYK